MTSNSLHQIQSILLEDFIFIDNESHQIARLRKFPDPCKKLEQEQWLLSLLTLSLQSSPNLPLSLCYCIIPLASYLLLTVCIWSLVAANTFCASDKVTCHLERLCTDVVSLEGHTRLHACFVAMAKHCSFPHMFLFLHRATVEMLIRMG